jgi:ferritin
MLSKKIEDALNKQVEIESSSSQFYLAMASWAENHGMNGVSAFMYKHADEERMHMLKLIKFINERGGKSIIPALPKPKIDFNSIKEIFESLLKHEVKVTNEINSVVDACLKDKDYTTHNFMQWYVAEQLEEEALARKIMDKLNLAGDDKGALYMFDRDLESLAAASGDE